jgi:membrane fusion protein, multidrug efflux system
MKAALTSLPRINPESPEIDAGDKRSPDVAAIPARTRVARHRQWWPIAVVIVFGGAAGAWHWHPQIAGLVGGHSIAAANGTADRPGNGKASLGFVAGGAGNAAKSGEPASPIQTVPLERRTRSEVLRVTGSLMADERSSIASNTSGIAAEVCVDRGSEVKTGDVLVRIDRKDAKLKHEEGEAVLDELRARLGIKGDLKDFKPENVPEVRIAKASEALAEANFRRAKENFAKKVVSKEAYDQLKTEYDLACLRSLQTEFQISQALYACKTAKIKVDILKKAVDDTEILAPFDGWVAEKLVAPGEQISSGMQATKVVTLVRINPLRLSLTVPQQDIGRIEPGQTVRFHVDSFPGRPFWARVRYIAPVVTNDTRTMVVEAVAENPKPDHPLRPGLFATAEVLLPPPPRKGSEEPPKAVWAPLSAVLRTGEVGRVFVARDGIARERIVALGDSDGQTIEILSGLTGTEILVANPGLVHDGDAVTR